MNLNIQYSIKEHLFNDIIAINKMALRRKSHPHQKHHQTVVVHPPPTTAAAKTTCKIATLTTKLNPSTIIAKDTMQTKADDDNNVIEEESESEFTPFFKVLIYLNLSGQVIELVSTRYLEQLRS